MERVQGESELEALGRVGGQILGGDVQRARGKILRESSGPGNDFERAPSLGRSEEHPGPLQKKL